MSTEDGSNAIDHNINVLLENPSKRAAILQQLGQLDLRFASHLTLSGTTGDSKLPTSSGSAPTPSGTFHPSYEGFPHPVAWYPFPQFPLMTHSPFPWINPALHQPIPPAPTRHRTEEPATHQDLSSTDDGEVLSEPEEEQDMVNLLEEGEADQFWEFDPEVKDPKKWQPPPSVVSYLNKHFNKSLANEDRKAIMEEYPVPDCAAVKAPKLDAEVMGQLRSKGKDLRFGVERNL